MRNKNTYDSGGANTLSGMRDGDPDLRWHHYAVTYSKGRGICTYIDGFRGPFVTAAGKVVVKGGGTVTLPTGVPMRGTWVIARGASVEDAGAGDLNERWTVTNLSKKHTVEFKVQNGEFTCTVAGPGLAVMVR